MTIWISTPSIFIPQARTSSTSEPNNMGTSLYQWYQGIYHRIFLAFSHSIDVIENGLLLPRACEMDREELATAAMSQLLVDNSTDWLPTMMIDSCSSAVLGGPAPTYKLAAKNNLTSVLPFAIDGQAGAEIAQALMFLRHMGETKTILSAVQRVTSPDTRIKRDGFSLADGSAAILVSSSPLTFMNSFHVLGVAVGQSTRNWSHAIETVLASALEEAKIARETIRWSIAHRLCDPFLLAARNVLPDSKWLIRDVYPDFDFGCADLLISLGRFCTISPLPLNEMGAVWFAGRWGAVGVILLASHNAGK